MTLPAVGASASRSKTITDSDIRTFATLSGDTNPVHLDEAAAAGTIFGKRVAHGMLTASLISAVLGCDLPGSGSIYLGQELRFVAPVFINDTVTATVEVIQVREDKRIITLRTIVTNQNARVVVEGKATVMMPSD
jgi:3-hydroxybutyryl-CoA dehydratase